MIFSGHYKKIPKRMKNDVEGFPVTDRTIFPETADIETSSDDYATRFSGEVGRYFLEVQLETVLELLYPFENPSILDVGGGHGQLAIPLVEKGYAVTVTGSHDSCCERLRKGLTEETYQYKTCDMLKLPYEDNSFDVVLAFRLIPHVDRWQELVAELSRVAKKAVIVDYPDIRSSNVLNFFFFHIKKAMEGNTRPFGLFRRKQVVSQFALNGMGKATLMPEFFLPMVFHRKMGSAKKSLILEKICKKLGLTHIFGSPIVLRVMKRKS